MGLADLVPGVSGGTVAFIVGIYDELVATIGSLGRGLPGAFREAGVRGVWQRANATFLAVLLAGILTSVAAFARLLHWLLEHHPAMLWAFFFGLVAASAPLVGSHVRSSGESRAAPGRQTDGRSPSAGALLALGIAGAAAAFGITSLPPLLQSDAPLFLAACAAVAACAMILPGISGSFILLILGAYAPAISAVKGFDPVRLAALASGAALGLLSFSRALKWLLDRRRASTLSVLAGFLVGSLNALWPWKERIRELYTHSDGRVEWLSRNSWPESFADVWPGAGLALLGAALVLALDRAARKPASRHGMYS